VEPISDVWSAPNDILNFPKRRREKGGHEESDQLLERDGIQWCRKERGKGEKKGFEGMHR